MTNKAETSRRMLTITWKYALAVLSVVAAALLTHLLGGLLATTPSVLFFAAIIISSWAGGMGPGLAAVLLSAFALDYFFITPRHLFIFSSADAPRLIVFMLISLLVGWLSASRKRAEQSLRQARDELEAKVEERTADLLKANESLKGEIARREQTEREREELMGNLATERALFEAVLRQMPAGVVISEAPSGKVVMGNEQVAEILRRPFKLARGVKQYESEYACYDREGCAYAPERMPLSRSLLTGEVVTGEEIHFERGDGTIGHVLLSSTPVRDRDGNIVAAVAIFHDNTEHKRIEGELRQSEERFSKAFNASPHLMTISTLADGRYLDVNEAVIRSLGYTREEMVGHTVAELNMYVDHNDRARLLRAFKEQEQVREMEVRYRGKDGRPLVVLLSAEIITLNGEQCLLTASNDITERKKTEEALRQSEDRFAKAFQSSPLALTITSLKTGRLIEVNETFTRLSGYTREEAVGRTTLELGLWAKPTDRETELAMVEKRGRVRNLEYRFRMKDGKELVGMLSAEQLEIGGEPCSLTVIEDITERKRAEESLRQSEERFSKAFKASPLPMSISTLADGRYLDVNDAMLDTVGYAREEIIGRTASELNAYARLEDRERIIRALNEGKPLRDIEIKFQAKDGHALIFSVSAEKVVLNGQECLLTASLDITERKQIEAEREQLLAREQQARHEAEAANRAKDEFLATVSHELRTPLNAVLGWADMLRGGKLEPELAKRGLETIARNAKSQAQLIEDLLDVSRIITGKLRLDVHPVGLIPIINAAVDGVRPAAFAKEIDLRVSLDPTVGSVTGDPTRLQQIVWNLLSNAIKFTPAGGSVEVRLEQMGRDASIVLCDSGMGINREFLPYVFDRFRQADSSYTRRHGGLGLGLAIVRHLVEMHGGTVEARSDGEGCGAMFIVNLPLAQMQIADFGFAVNKGDEENNSSLITHHSSLLLGLRALVVDDEPDARELIKIALEQHGAKVTTAASAAEAIAALNQFVDGNRIDVILSDIGMPGEDGLSLINKVRAVKSIEKIPAIALTAYARDEDRERALKAGYEMHIAKPFNPSDLAEAVASVARKSRHGVGE